MSHFSVAVFTEPNGKTVEELLAPYQENNMGDCPAEYLEFHDQADEVKEDWEKCKDREEYGNDIKTFAKEYHGYKEHEGKFGYWENPNRKWDWWVIGGRWNGMLLIKKDADGNIGELGAFGHRHEKETPAPAGYKWVDSAKVKDICWDVMVEMARKEREKHWEEAQGKDDFEKHFIYGIKEGMTREQYIDAAGTFSTFAVITPDGKWHEKGNMGWWACVSDEKEGWTDNYFEAFLKNADPELTITIVDCHI